MTFTGDRLFLIMKALYYASDEVRNWIATCPDVIQYAYDIEAYEKEYNELRKAQIRVIKSLEREGYTIAQEWIIEPLST